jgi:hypothetical protein
MNGKHIDGINEEGIDMNNVGLSYGGKTKMWSSLHCCNSFIPLALILYLQRA